MEQTLLTARIAFVSALAMALWPSLAQADIKSPGAHYPYGTSVDLHLVVQWNEEVFDEGIGPGMRIHFPVIDNGPIPSINNNLAIGTGIDLTFSDGDCGPFDCSAWQFWIPLTVQWNFFFTEAFSVFPELGLALQYVNIDYPVAFLDGDDDDIDLEFVFWLGGRYMFTPAVGMTLRIGVPSLLLGATFLF